MVDFPKFFSTAAELYGLWPTFFKVVGGSIVPIIGGLVTATWWMRGYKADAREAVLEGQNVALQGQLAAETATLKGELAAAKGQLETQVAGLMGQLETERAALKGQLEAQTAALKGQIDVLTQRLALATEQQKAATEQAKKFEAELAQLKARASRGQTPTSLETITIDLEKNFQGLIAANKAVTSTLTFADELDRHS